MVSFEDYRKWFCLRGEWNFTYRYAIIFFIKLAFEKENQMLEIIVERTNQYIQNMSKEERKKYGQFFTGMETARFMANLYSISYDKTTVSVLDAGAGSGMLSCAFIERLDRLDFIQSIEVTCYETDENILGLLRENLEYCRINSQKEISYQIVTENSTLMDIGSLF